ncbi:LysR substrate-binding domain-containing protein, partial [Streptomyces sp. MBT61]|uniref:LysR substrate-binding domain-containing protein n=1 Tax=Streptomyces sp. MBT61 TaxID=1488392 RepID=UPI001F26051D
AQDAGARAALGRALDRRGGGEFQQRLGAAESGAGPCVLSELALGEELSSRRLLKVPVAGVRLRRQLRAVWPGGHRPTGPARDLLSLTGRDS